MDDSTGCFDLKRCVSFWNNVDGHLFVLAPPVPRRLTSIQYGPYQVGI